MEDFDGQRDSQAARSVKSPKGEQKAKQENPLKTEGSIKGAEFKPTLRSTLHSSNSGKQSLPSRRSSSSSAVSATGLTRNQKRKLLRQKKKYEASVTTASYLQQTERDRSHQLNDSDDHKVMQKPRTAKRLNSGRHSILNLDGTVDIYDHLVSSEPEDAQDDTIEKEKNRTGLVKQLRKEEKKRRKEEKRQRKEAKKQQTEVQQQQEPTEPSSPPSEDLLPDFKHKKRRKVSAIAEAEPVVSATTQSFKQELFNNNIRHSKKDKKKNQSEEDVHSIRSISPSLAMKRAGSPSSSASKVSSGEPTRQTDDLEASGRLEASKDGNQNEDQDLVTSVEADISAGAELISTPDPVLSKADNENFEQFEQEHNTPTPSPKEPSLELGDLSSAFEASEPYEISELNSPTPPPRLPSPELGDISLISPAIVRLARPRSRPAIQEDPKREEEDEQEQNGEEEEEEKEEELLEVPESEFGKYQESEGDEGSVITGSENSFDAQQQRSLDRQLILLSPTSAFTAQQELELVTSVGVKELAAVQGLAAENKRTPANLEDIYPLQHPTKQNIMGNAASAIEQADPNGDPISQYRGRRNAPQDGTPSQKTAKTRFISPIVLVTAPLKRKRVEEEEPFVTESPRKKPHVVAREVDSDQDETEFYMHGDADANSRVAQSKNNHPMICQIQ